MIKIPLLPYSIKDLAPFISKETMELHYGKHLQNYVDTLNNLVDETSLQDVPLTELIRVCKGPIFNNAAQVWNHDFFFKSIRPKTQMELSKPTVIPEQLFSLIEKNFSSVPDFLNRIRNVSAEMFGAGYVWVCWNEDDTLEVSYMTGAGTPLRYGKMPILCIDLWEHSYYLDYKNRRLEFVNVCLKLLDWSEIDRRLSSWKLCRHCGASF